MILEYAFNNYFNYYGFCCLCQVKKKIVNFVSSFYYADAWSTVCLRFKGCRMGRSDKVSLLVCGIINQH